MTVTMYDATDVAHLPPGAAAYAGYVGGKWPTWGALVDRFHAKAHLLSIAVTAAEHALCLDVENGDATPAQAPGWVKTEHGRNVPRPCVYASAAVMPEVVAHLGAAGIERKNVRLWSAHYGQGAHICGPASCKFPGVPAMDGTQWTNAAAAEGGSVVDVSLLEDDFFPPPPADGYVVTVGAAGGYAGRAVTSHDGGKTWT
jgi:hypothetical protein